MSKKRNLTILLILIFWPISIFLANTPKDFLNYLLPIIIAAISYFLFRKKKEFYLFPTILIPIIQPKLAILPLLLLGIDAIFFSKKFNKFFLLLSLITLLMFWKEFTNQTIFMRDYNAQQFVIRKTLLYPNVLLARSFQNKARIYIDKLNENFFSLTDPNNYFFGFQPRQITVNNQNLDKYPFLAIFLFIFGLYYLDRSKDKKFIITFIVSSIISLSLLTNFDRHDFILWIPMSLIVVSGVTEIENKLKQRTKYFYFCFIIFGIAQLLRLFIQYLK